MQNDVSNKNINTVEVCCKIGYVIVLIYAALHVGIFSIWKEKNVLSDLKKKKMTVQIIYIFCIICN